MTNPISAPSRQTRVPCSLNAKGTQFVLAPRGGMGRVVTKLPSRRFNKRTNLWTAPTVFLNAKELRDNQRQFIFTAEAKAKILDLHALREIKQKPLPITYIHKTKPYEVQKVALDFAYGLKSSALFMEMGLGKSKVLSDLFCAKAMDGQVDTMVVIMPPNVTDNFAAEFVKHSPIPIVPHVLNSSSPVGRRKAVEYLSNGDRFHVFVASIQGLVTLKEDKAGVVVARGHTTDILEQVITNSKCLLALDESQSIMTATSKRTINALYLRYLSFATQSLIMTGTPISTNILGLYSQYEFLDNNIIGSGDLYGFKQQFCVMGGFKNRSIIAYDNLDQLFELVSPFTFVATKEEWLDLPPKLYETRHVQMTPNQKKVYAETKKTRIIDLKEDRKKIIANVLGLMTALHQIAGGYLLQTDHEIVGEEKIETRTVHELVPPSKNPKILDLLQFLKDIGGKPTIVWVYYREEQQAVFDALNKEYPGEVIWLEAGCNTKKETEGFHTGEKKFIVSNVQVGGVGLTLNEAKYAFYFSNGTQPILRNQSEARNHRIGQDESVTIVDCVARGSRDATVLRSLRESMAFDEYLKTQIKEYNENGGTLPEVDDDQFTEKGAVESALKEGRIEEFIAAL